MNRKNIFKAARMIERYGSGAPVAKQITLFAHINMGGQFEEDGYHLPNGQVIDPVLFAMGWLGLTLGQAWALFGPDYPGPDKKVRSLDIAVVLRRLAHTGEVDWETARALVDEFATD